MAASLWPSLGSAAAVNQGADSMRSSAFMTVNEGSGPIASVVSIPAAARSPLQMAVGWALTKPLIEWMAASVGGGPVRASKGRVIVPTSPANLTQLTEYDWVDAVATQLQFPDTDASTDITVTYLGRDLASALATVVLRGCRLVSVAPTTPQPPARAGRTTLTFAFAGATFGMSVLA
jgi:hypothetical protein